MLRVGNILEMYITHISMVWNSKDLGEILSVRDGLQGKKKTVVTITI